MREYYSDAITEETYIYLDQTIKSLYEAIDHYTNCNHTVNMEYNTTRHPDMASCSSLHQYTVYWNVCLRPLSNILVPGSV